MGCIVDKDKEYRYLVNMTIDSQEHFVKLLKGFHGQHDYGAKHRTWLHLLGLLETWDLVE